MKVCPQCQKEYTDDQKFCSQCAAPLVAKETVVAAPVAVPAATPVAPAKKRSGLWIAVGVVVGLVVLLALAGVGVFLYWRYFPRQEFAVANLRFADSESAPPRANTEYKPEEEVQLFYEVPGYQRDSESRLAVVTHNTVLAPGGKLLYKPQLIEVKQRVGSDAGPVKCRFTVKLPAWAPPGTYTIKIEAEDQIAQKTLNTETSFTVNAPPLEISETLVASGVEVSMSRDGAAVTPPVFTAGDKIWLRYRILGLKADEQGRVDVSEDWGVVGPEGNSVFQKTDDSLIRGQFDYPPPMLPVHKWVDTPRDLQPGDYKFQIVVHDKIAGADYSFEQPFTIQKP